MTSINLFFRNEISETSVISEIHKYHPLFRLMIVQSVDLTFQSASILCLKPSQILFKEGSRETLIYIILYGKIVIRTMDQGVLGVVGPGESVGEESFLTINYKYRYF